MLTQAQERLRLLTDVSSLLASSLDHHITLQEIAHLLVPTQADYCRIALVDEQQQIKEVTVNHIDPEKNALVQALYEQYKDLPNTTYGLPKLLLTGKAELIADVSENVLALYRENPELLTTLQALGLKSYMGVPMLAHGKTVGAIILSSIQPDRHYEEDDLLFAQEIAQRIALALDNARLYEEAQAEIAERKQIEQHLRFLSEAGKLLASSLDYETTLRDGVPLRAIYYPFHDRGGAQYIGVVAVPLGPVLRSFQVLVGVVCLAVALGGLAAGLMAGRFARRLTLPLEQIAQAARSIDDHSLDVRIAATSTDAEIQAVTEILNAMLARLQATFEAQRRFLADASHELRSPLSNLRGTVDVTLRRKRPAEEYENALRVASAEAERMSRLVNDLLLISRADVGQFTINREPCNLTEIARQAATAHASAATCEEVRICVDAPGPVIVCGDFDRLRQVIDNLLDNALRYAPPRTDIDLRVADGNGRSALVAVHNRGPALSPSDQEHVFERFYRADVSRSRSSGGSGLGLSIARTIVEAHAGAIRVYSMPEEGTTFEVRLPALEVRA